MSTSLDEQKSEILAKYKFFPHYCIKQTALKLNSWAWKHPILGTITDSLEPPENVQSTRTCLCVIHTHSPSEQIEIQMQSSALDLNYVNFLTSSGRPEGQKSTSWLHWAAYVLFWPVTYLAISFVMRSSLQKLIHTAGKGHLTVSEPRVWESGMSVFYMVGEPATLPPLPSPILQSLPQEQATTQGSPLCLLLFLLSCCAERCEEGWPHWTHPWKEASNSPYKTDLRLALWLCRCILLGF